VRAEDLNEDFVDILKCLLDADVDFLLVGAHALAHHGIVRATGDLDLWVRCRPSNARRAFEALSAFGAPLSSGGLSVEDLAKPGTVYQMGLPPRRIDVLTEISGVDFDEAWPLRGELNLAGLRIPVLDRESLLANKRAAARPKDLADVEALEALDPPD